MSQNSVPSRGPVGMLYRLRGRINGVERSVSLLPGEHRVGSSAASDLRLCVEGVSRQHAVLRVSTGSLTVEDRGSKNGTSVNGRRVDRASVAVGSRLAFGPAGFQVEAVERDDVDLGLVVGAPAVEGANSGGSPYLDETSSLSDVLDDSTAQSWLWLVEGFGARLLSSPECGASAAFAYLVETLGATGSCLVEWRNGAGPVVLAGYGELAEVPPWREISQQPSSRDQTTTLRFERGVGIVWLGDAATACLGLWVWGDFAKARESEVLLHILLQLLVPHFSLLTGEAREAPLRPPATPVPELIFPDDHLPGVSPPMQRLYRQMRPLLRGDLPVLLVGETGVGKEKLARLLHHSSQRRDGPLVTINCAAIPLDLVEAEFFGIARRVATGVDARPGKFQLAQGGTLFLDEIAEMAPPLQAKLLRVLQEKKVQPVGGEPQNIDVRVVAATNADLDRRMAEGTFRHDLYYRLAGCVLEIPPLRACKQDMVPLIEHFLKRLGQQAGVQLRGVSVKALRLMLAYPWPGNIRELEHEIRRLVYQGFDGDVIDTSKLSRKLLSAPRGEAEEAAPDPGESFELAPRVHELERRLIRQALLRSGGQQARAARLLGISRNGLTDKMKRLDIDLDSFRSEC